MILVDTSVWVDFFAGRSTVQTSWFERHLGTEEFVLGDLVMVELLQGFREGRDVRIVERQLEPFRVHELCGDAIARKAADNFRTLRAAGVTIRGTIDVIIATWCIENGAMLLHADRDFVAMERIGLNRAQ